MVARRKRKVRKEVSEELIKRGTMEKRNLGRRKKKKGWKEG